jgi:cytoskeletal protein CcmA (bactofilin family)
MRKFLLFLTIVLFVASPLFTRAARFERGSSVIVSSQEVVSENFYGFGRDVSVSGTVSGDAVLAGASVFVPGTVSGDVLAAGGTVNVLGTVSGDVRVAAGEVIISGDVGGDVIAAGGSVRIISGARIGGDVIAAGGMIVFEGETQGAFRVAAGSVRIDGVVERDTIIQGADEIVIGKTSRLHGSFTYYSPVEARIEDGAAIIGSVSFQPITSDHAGSQSIDRNSKAWFSAVLLFFGVWWMLKVLSLIVLSLLAVRLFGSSLQSAVEYIEQNPGVSLLYGFSAVALTPIAIVLLCITVVGFLLGVVGVFSYLLFLILSTVLSAFLIGSLFFSKILKKRHYAYGYGSAIVGVILFELICLIPFVGWIVALLVFFASAGVLAKRAYQVVA